MALIRRPGGAVVTCRMGILTVSNHALSPTVSSVTVPFAMKEIDADTTSSATRSPEAYDSSPEGDDVASSTGPTPSPSTRGSRTRQASTLGKGRACLRCRGRKIVRNLPLCRPGTLRLALAMRWETSLLVLWPTESRVQIRGREVPHAETSRQNRRPRGTIATAQE